MSEIRRFSTERPYSSSSNPSGSEPNNPIQEFGDPNVWLQNAQIPFNAPDAISMTLMPGLYQYAEFAQQMYMQQFLNWYNSAPEEMQRAMQAGINPYLAANGIAGASSPIASAPNSAIGAGAQSLGSLVNGLGTLGNLASNGIRSYIDLFKMKHEVANLDVDTEKKFVELGFSSLQSKALSISLKYLDTKEQIGIWQALADYDKTSQEYNNLVAEHRNVLAQYEQIIAQKDLLIATEGEVNALKKLHDAEAAKTQEMTKFMQLERQFFVQHGYKLGSPIYESIRDSIVSGKPLDTLSFGNVISSYQQGLDVVHFNAQASASWNSRPQTAFELGAMYANRLGNTAMNILRQNPNANAFLNSLEKISNKEAKSDFDIAFDDAKSDLYNNYRYARSEYRKYKNTGISDTEKAKLYDKMKSAKQEYDSFTREKFADSLCKSFRW